MSLVSFLQGSQPWSGLKVSFLQGSQPWYGQKVSSLQGSQPWYGLKVSSLQGSRALVWPEVIGDEQQTSLYNTVV